MIPPEEAKIDIWRHQPTGISRCLIYNTLPRVGGRMPLARVPDITFCHPSTPAFQVAWPGRHSRLSLPITGEDEGRRAESVQETVGKGDKTQECSLAVGGRLWDSRTRTTAERLCPVCQSLKGRNGKAKGGGWKRR